MSQIHQQYMFIGFVVLLVIFTGITGIILTKFNDLRNRAEHWEEVFNVEVKNNNDRTFIYDSVLEKKNRQIEIKDQTIKFLSEQNIILTDKAGEIPEKFESEILKDERVKQAYNKFIDILQFSKGG